MGQSLTRRQVMAMAGAGAAAAATSSALAQQQQRKARRPAVGARLGATFLYSLNTSTIREQKLTLAQQVDLAIDAGYEGIEPWIRDVQAYRDGGGSLADVRKRCQDGGLAVCSAIGFAQWIVDDDAARAKGLEQAKQDMDLVAQIGGTHIAAPPVGATRGDKIDLHKAAERYRALLEVGRQTGVIPQIEVWGFSVNCSKLSESTFIAVEAAHPDACILPDIFHLYKGGNDTTSLKLLSRAALHCFHLNDYPRGLDRQTAKDADRVYPGDGVGPVVETLKILAANHCQTYLSLELFNKDYWAQPAASVARTGLEKMKVCAAAATG